MLVSTNKSSQIKSLPLNKYWFMYAYKYIHMYAYMYTWMSIRDKLLFNVNVNVMDTDLK